MKFVYAANDVSHPVEIERTSNGIDMQIEGTHPDVELIATAPPRITFLYNGKIVSAAVVSEGKRRWAHFDGATFLLNRVEEKGRDASQRESRAESGSGLVTAPMPGQVRAVLANAGDAVELGQTLLLLEAMKMEIRVTAPRTGTLISLAVAQGQNVEREQVLGEIGEEQG